MSEDRRGLAVESRRLIDNLKARNHIEVPIGVLMTCADVRRAMRLANARPRATKPCLVQANSPALGSMWLATTTPHRTRRRHSMDGATCWR